MQPIIKTAPQLPKTVSRTIGEYINTLEGWNLYARIPKGEAGMQIFYRAKYEYYRKKYGKQHADLLEEYFEYRRAARKQKETAKMNELIQNTSLTPIEVLLKVDEDGTVSAKDVYEFLELDASNYSRWCKNNIVETNLPRKTLILLRSSLMTNGIHLIRTPLPPTAYPHPSPKSCA